MTDCCNITQDSPAWRFRTLHNAHRCAVDAALGRFGVREFGQPFILFMLEREGDGAYDTQRKISQRLGVSPATVTASLQSLEKQGCIRRVSCESDMRRKRIEITDAGRDAAAKCRRAFQSVDESMYEGFTQAELDTLAGFFERMTANLRSTYSDDGGTKE